MVGTADYEVKNPWKITLFLGFLSILIGGGLVIASYYLLTESDVSRKELIDAIEVPCEITKLTVEVHEVGVSYSDPEDRKKKKQLVTHAEFNYSYQDESYTSEHVVLHGCDQPDAEQISQKLYEKNQLNKTMCFLLPDSPEEAFLFKTSEYEIYVCALVFLVGIILVIIGISVSIHGLKLRKAGLSKTLHLNKKSHTKKKMLLIAIFIGCSIAGCFYAYHAVMSYGTKSWEKTTGTVLHCYVNETENKARSRRSLPDSYSLEILYTYTYEGETFYSHKTRWLKSSSFLQHDRNIYAEEHSAGAEVICYVNPKKPWEAVIFQDFGNTILWGSVNLFMAFILFAALGEYVKRKVKFVDTQTIIGNKANLSRVLKPIRIKRGRALIILLPFIAGGIYYCYRGYLAVISDNPDWFFYLLTGGFFLFIVGVCCCVHGRKLLTANEASAKMVLRPGYIEIGEATNLKWVMPKKTVKLSKFSISIEGIEEVQYESGEGLHKKHETFYCETLVDQQAPFVELKGIVEVLLKVNDPSVLPSFETKHNKIEWIIFFQGKTKRGIKYHHGYPVSVVYKSK